MAADTCLDGGSGGLEVEAPPTPATQPRPQLVGWVPVLRRPGSGRRGRPGYEEPGGLAGWEAAGRVEGEAGRPRAGGQTPSLLCGSAVEPGRGPQPGLRAG